MYVSGIDILDGTPVIDIKPFIPHYDLPRNLLCEGEIFMNEHEESSSEKPNELNVVDCRSENLEDNFKKTNCSCKIVKDEELNMKIDKIKISTENVEFQKILNANSFIPHWVNFPPVSRLQVIFNPIAEKQIKSFSPEASIPFRYVCLAFFLIIFSTLY